MWSVHESSWIHPTRINTSNLLKYDLRKTPEPVWSDLNTTNLGGGVSQEAGAPLK